jgi:hypothetical protein
MNTVHDLSGRDVTLLLEGQGANQKAREPSSIAASMNYAIWYFAAFAPRTSGGLSGCTDETRRCENT